MAIVAVGTLAAGIMCHRFWHRRNQKTHAELPVTRHRWHWICLNINRRWGTLPRPSCPPLVRLSWHTKMTWLSLQIWLLIFPTWVLHYGYDAAWKHPGSCVQKQRSYKRRKQWQNPNCPIRGCLCWCQHLGWSKMWCRDAKNAQR